MNNFPLITITDASKASGRGSGRGSGLQLRQHPALGRSGSLSSKPAGQVAERAGRETTTQPGSNVNRLFSFSRDEKS